MGYNEQTITDSETINMPGADFAIVSSDKVRFRVHRAKLAAASIVFGDMLDVGTGPSSGGETVDLVESADVLARILPFIYPNVISPIDLCFPKDDEFIEALLKFEMFRGLEAVALGFHRHLATPGVRPELGFALRAVRLAVLLHDTTLARSYMLQILEILADEQDINAVISPLPGVPLRFKEDLATRLTFYLHAVTVIRDKELRTADGFVDNRDSRPCTERGCRVAWVRALTSHTLQSLQTSLPGYNALTCACSQYLRYAVRDIIASVEKLDLPYPPCHVV